MIQLVKQYRSPVSHKNSGLEVSYLKKNIQNLTQKPPWETLMNNMTACFWEQKLKSKEFLTFRMFNKMTSDLGWQYLCYLYHEEAGHRWSWYGYGMPQIACIRRPYAGTYWTVVFCIPVETLVILMTYVSHKFMTARDKLSVLNIHWERRVIWKK